MTKKWWNEKVAYQIYPKSLAPFLAWCLIGAVACWFSGNV